MQDGSAAVLGSFLNDEHRAISQGLTNLADAIQKRDRRRIRIRLNLVMRLSGPHFRYEEDSLYPALVGRASETHLAQLLNVHDQAILALEELSVIATKGGLTPAETQLGLALTENVMSYVKTCESGSTLLTVLPDVAVQATLESRGRACMDGLDLLQWAHGQRSAARALTGI